jgi:hypothetical protein
MERAGTQGAEPELSGRAFRPDTAGRRPRAGSPRAGTRRTRAGWSDNPSTQVEITQKRLARATSLAERWSQQLCQDAGGMLLVLGLAMIVNGIPHDPSSLTREARPAAT